MKLNIELDLENAAFEDNLFEGVQQILKKVPERIFRLEGGEFEGAHCGLLFDSNGNNVGYAVFTETEDLK